MAKLYGTADSTLVSAAFKEGISKVPLDLSSVYAQREKNIVDFSTNISKLMDGIYAKNNALSESITEKSQAVAEIMKMEGGLNNEYAIRQHTSVVERYKERLKKINPLKGGDKDRQDLQIEMDKYNKSMLASTAMLNSMVNNAANQRLLNDLDSPEANLYNAILDDAINKTYETKPEYVDGDMVYSLPGTDVKMTMADINKGLSAHDPAFLTDFHANLNDLATRARTLGGAMTAKDVVRWKNDTNQTLLNWNQIRNVAQEKFGGATHSFEEVLHGQAKDPVTGEVDTSALRIIFEQLDDIGGIDMDGDGNPATMVDGVNIDRGMYSNPANGEKLIAALKKDKTKYKELMVGYLGETVIKDYWKEGASQYKKPGGGNANDHFFLGKQFIPKSDVTPDVILLNKDADNIPATTGWNGVQWRKRNGQYQYVKGKDEDGNFIFGDATRDEVALALGFDAKVGYKAGDGIGTPAPEANKPGPITTVNNNKPSIKGVPYPPRGITRSMAGPSKSNIEKLTEMYAAYDVLFSKQDNELLMTGPDGETQSVPMNRWGDRDNMESQDLIQQFILNYAK